MGMEKDGRGMEVGGKRMEDKRVDGWMNKEMRGR